MFPAQLAELETGVSVKQMIERVPLGARVPALNPLRWDYDSTFAEPEESSWAKLTLVMRKRDGGVVDAELLRPRAWIAGEKVSGTVSEKIAFRFLTPFLIAPLRPHTAPVGDENRQLNFYWTAWKNESESDTTLDQIARFNSVATFTPGGGTSVRRDGRRDDRGRKGVRNRFGKNSFSVPDTFSCSTFSCSGA